MDMYDVLHVCILCYMPGYCTVYFARRNLLTVPTEIKPYHFVIFCFRICQV